MLRDGSEVGVQGLGWLWCYGFRLIKDGLWRLISGRFALDFEWWVLGCWV